MSTFTINKLASGVYGTLFLLCAALLLLAGGTLIYFALNGLPDWKPISEAVARAGIDQKTLEMTLAVGGVLTLALALIPIIIGVLACMQNIWAMIVGTVLWVLLFGSAAMDGGFAELGQHKFEVASIVVFVLLTIVAVVWRVRPTDLTRSPPSAAAALMRQ